MNGLIMLTLNQLQQNGQLKKERTHNSSWA